MVTKSLAGWRMPPRPLVELCEGPVLLNAEGDTLSLEREENWLLELLDEGETVQVLIAGGEGE